MKLHEYQAKELLAKFGVPVPPGVVASTPQEAKDATAKMGGKSIVKAQVHAGGRGKAGGVKFANTPEEAAAHAQGMLGKRLVTFQTGPGGVPVDKVLIASPVDIAKELYFSITTDGGRRRPVVIASAEGGVEIEEVAKSHPEKIITEAVDPLMGFMPYQGRRIAYKLGLPAELVRPFGDMVTACYKMFMDKDLNMVEINPLVITKENKLIALDAKVTFEDDALYRHAEDAKLRDSSQEDPLELEAANAGISYVKLDGNVGCLVNGAGLAMATMDTIKMGGGQPANFLDVGGSANEEKVVKAVQLMISDSNVQKILINIFGGILRCDIVARGVVDAYKVATRKPPLVVRLLGTNVNEAKEIFKTSGLPIKMVDTLQEVAVAVRG